MTDQPKTEWEKTIQLNLDCGCTFGICKKCSPMIEIIKSLLTQAQEQAKREVTSGFATSTQYIKSVKEQAKGLATFTEDRILMFRSVNIILK